MEPHDLAEYPRADMRCPSCGELQSRVIDSRPADAGSSIRRRRMCETCDHRFTTYERLLAVELVVKRDGGLESFQPDKIKRGLVAALADRPVDPTRIASVVEAVEKAVQMSVNPFPSIDIGTIVLARLRAIDEIAYLRFASVYKDFVNTEDFERELAAMEAESETARSET